MYSRFGRRTRRISDSKTTVKPRDLRRLSDADDEDEDIIEGKEAEALKNLTDDEVQGLLELLPYKDALIKIAKGEFEIEKVEEVEEDENGDEGTEGTEGAEEENFEEDDDFNEDAEGTEDDEDADYDEYEDAEDEPLEDSAEKMKIWEARLKGNDN